LCRSLRSKSLWQKDAEYQVEKLISSNELLSGQLKARAFIKQKAAGEYRGADGGDADGEDNMPRGARTNVGRIYRSKRWAKRWAKGRRVKKVTGGYKIMSGKKRTPAQERAHRRKKYRRRKRRSNKTRLNNFV